MKFTCNFSDNVSASFSIFVSSGVISSTLLHSSLSAPTSCHFCRPHALRPLLNFFFPCFWLQSTILISWPMMRALLEIWIQSCLWKYLRQVCSVLSMGSIVGIVNTLNAFCKELPQCSPITMLYLKMSSHCLHRDVISADKFGWLLELEV